MNHESIYVRKLTEEQKEKRRASKQGVLLILKEAYRQGSLKEPLSGKAKFYSDESDKRELTGLPGYYPNPILKKYLRGVDGLQYHAHLEEFLDDMEDSISDTSNNDTNI
ncbi:hypothetical protein UFOVP1470_54 [uncultured Caudovirales phage]|uniref:Uncharacterized protein n=1 Tax=uncultured Caudovirales phage TaxID=2100421 RepID=A0A6J5S2L4_9CAUD|nr:hypothetical protein UFOVP939_25 [uncultured Caudovirales phage]CAB4178596.1 hypothetical protein UFOVP1018_52 [uncultured Caudovirales phage]CAB4184335.1 hypothetical protein UFOVP1105_53 [uncultured Caudovirales phage]CAB4202870.1 hypothetical protein UFOVP1372_43 [uncultured Caudovirales phage]CAB4215063.1 hypothetical protein UFOVP1470_54 [uncultured Caudovirales phage]